MKDDMAMTVGKSRVLSHEDLPILQTSRKKFGFYRMIGKRIFDIALVLVTLPATLPIIGILALIVMLDGGKPFFGHQRVGRNGRNFKCWKIRSMVLNAEIKLQEHLRNDAAARAEWEANFKLTNDPRITMVGDFLRRSSLDELPQIWNILKGEMSFVGPRPVTRKELDMYGSARECYQALYPGLTGLWQVSGRNDVNYRDRVLMDVKYASSYSFSADVKIIMETAGIVIRRTGR